MVSLQGIKIDALEKVSVMVSIVLYVLDSGSFTMKSSAIDSKGSVKVSGVMGKMGGFRFMGLFFCDWQVAHPLM